MEHRVCDRPQCQLTQLRRRERWCVHDRCRAHERHHGTSQSQHGQHPGQSASLAQSGKPPLLSRRRSPAHERLAGEYRRPGQLRLLGRLAGLCRRRCTRCDRERHSPPRPGRGRGRSHGRLSLAHQPAVQPELQGRRLCQRQRRGERHRPGSGDARNDRQHPPGRRPDLRHRTRKHPRLQSERWSQCRYARPTLRPVLRHRRQQRELSLPGRYQRRCVAMVSNPP